jgi:REP element-mobilizing transposase RayT
MARRPRIDLAGYHHVINRGVARSNIFLDVEDKNKFLEILNKACVIYKVVIHDYCIMDNHYHILIETSQENLSLFMRQINSNYAIYFNKKNRRSGHLWQGRYKSYYVTREAYLYTLIKYIEYNPIEAKITNNVSQYPFTLAYTIVKNEAVLISAKKSILLIEFSIEELIDFLEVKLHKKDLKYLMEEEKRKITIENDSEFKIEKSKTLASHFCKIYKKEDRNLAIVNAFKDGYRQSEIANYIQLSSSLISKIVKSGDSSPDP